MIRSIPIRREGKRDQGTGSAVIQTVQEGEKERGVAEMNNSGIIAIVVAILSLEVGLNTLIKASIRQGMSNYVFIVYAHVVASLVLVPLAFIYHKIKPFPKLTFPILSKIFLLAFLAYDTIPLFPICTYAGIGYSSPTLSSAISNLTPGFTFLIAIIFGMEKLDLRSYSSQAKWIGTIVSIAGAFVMNFYKGPPIIFHMLSNNEVNDHLLLHPVLSNWIIGGSLFTLSSFVYALLYIVLARVMKDYPSELMITTITGVFVAIQSTVVALIVERDLNAWKLGLNLELVTICYSGIMVHSLRTIAYVWVVGLKGPVFITSFKPLEMLVAVVLGVTFLGDTVYIGSVIGGAIIAAGFYSVMWGKAKELNTVVLDDQNEASSYSTSDKAPFLQASNMDV